MIRVLLYGYMDININMKFGGQCMQQQQQESIIDRFLVMVSESPRGLLCDRCVLETIHGIP